MVRLIVHADDRVGEHEMAVLTWPVSRAGARVRLSLVNDYEIVVEGLARMLAPFSERVAVVEIAANVQPFESTDIELVDMFSAEPSALRDILRHSRAAKIVIYTWAMDPDVVEMWLTLGIAGVLSKTLSAVDLVDALERVHAGEIMVAAGAPVPEAMQPAGDWPGRGVGLGARESEIIALVAEGLSNQQIADRTFISLNTVKTNIRTAYRKIGVSSRTQAVRWALEHGFQRVKVRRRPADDTDR